MMILVGVEKVTRDRISNSKTNYIHVTIQGRDDVYALRWENIKRQCQAIPPVALNSMADRLMPKADRLLR